MVADNPDQLVSLKTFHCKILNDHNTIEHESNSYVKIPEVRKVDNIVVQRNYQQIKREVQDIIESEMEKILNDPARQNTLVKK